MINAISQSSDKCAETSEINLFHRHTCIQQSRDRQTDRQTDRQRRVEVHVYSLPLSITSLGSGKRWPWETRGKADCTKAKSSTESPRNGGVADSAILSLMRAENQLFFFFFFFLFPHWEKLSSQAPWSNSTPHPPTPSTPLPPVSRNVFYFIKQQQSVDTKTTHS